MALLGVVLVVLAAAVTAILMLQNAGEIALHALGHTQTLPAYWLLIAGLVTMAVGCAGMEMLRWSGMRAYARRLAAKQEREMNRGIRVRDADTVAADDREVVAH